MLLNCVRLLNRLVGRKSAEVEINRTEVLVVLRCSPVAINTTRITTPRAMLYGRMSQCFAFLCAALLIIVRRRANCIR